MDLQVLEAKLMNLQIVEAAEPVYVKSRKQAESPLRKSERRLKMVSASYYIPEDIKKNPDGEDAHFICLNEQAIGVADGASGWSRHGIDAGKYALKLMINSANAIRKIKASSLSVVDPKKVLCEAFAGAIKQKGSSTACIIALNGRVLHAANVGHSRFIVFRDKQFFYSSPIQQHGFNFPYQLGYHETCDRPDCALEPKVPVMDGDIVVLGIDGLLDNLFTGKIERIIKKADEVKPRDLAEKIAGMAYCKTLNNNCETPFSSMYKLLGGKKRLGGKKDGITVIRGHMVGE